MRIIVYEDYDKKIETWEVSQVIAEIWDIYVEEHNIKGTATWIQYNQFLLVALKVKKMSPDKF